ncbi:hypothetical protein [Desulfogranum marinum]|uniref:hypothetical protein n=1 Tax=Desulfogranum marinum TaxID=453220 RepID=UPI001965B621|nr:hypothetical protein [Desulfogranum marinum]MBM9515240.1 hypothetical protein [Desulfogranum marinum]
MSSALLGKNRVEESAVIAVPDVPFTRTHHPIHHREVIGVVKEALGFLQLDIIKQEYVLAAQGNQMFSVWDLDSGTPEMKWSIGIRNSLNRSMAFGVTAGTKVLVCDNMAFSGEYLALRRHTSGLTSDELGFLAFKTMKQMVPRLRAFQSWHESLRKYPLTEDAAKILLVEIMTNNVIPASKFHQFNELYANIYDNGLWGFHEAATDVLKGSNLLTLPQKNKLLNGVINSYIDSLDTANRSTLGDFYQKRAINL